MVIYGYGYYRTKRTNTQEQKKGRKVKYTVRVAIENLPDLQLVLVCALLVNSEGLSLKILPRE
jgi:hypothetical protein